MGMPTINSGNGTRNQAVTDMVTTVALEQAALSHILNAEGEKIQKVVANSDTSVDDLLAVNKSVKSMVNTITRLQMVLQGKLELFEDGLLTTQEENKPNNEEIPIEEPIPEELPQEDN